MIKIEKTSIYGFVEAIRGMRNPTNSWDEVDSFVCGDDKFVQCSVCENNHEGRCYDLFVMGDNDHKLMMNLAADGSVHAKYRQMITVYVDIIAPLYWWKEFDTYKVGIVVSSCSTVHKIHAKEFTWEDFSVEHLTNFGMWGEQFTDADAVYAPAKTMGCIISALNGARDRYLDFKSRGTQWGHQAKQAWWQMIQLLPSSYNQKRTVMLNYEVLVGIYRWRKGHKLDEWREFCRWIEQLPYSEIIVGEKDEVSTEK